MNTYISSYITGFADVIKKDLPKQLPGATIQSVYDGLVAYNYNGNWTNIRKVKYLNNSFKVIKFFYGDHLSFPNMVSQVQKLKSIASVRADTFRVRFSKENQFSSVNRNISISAEQHLCKTTRMRIDRVNPQTEFWYIIRREKVGFFAQLLEKRKVTEKKLNQGELRPEFAYLMCCCADIKANSVVCDPFCGYGAIPNQLTTSYRLSHIFASDIDSRKIFDLKKTRLSKCSNVTIQVADATELTYLRNESIDAVITDPPWGIYEKIDDITDFYSNVLKEMLRVLKPTGSLICLSAKKEEFKKACLNTNFKIITQIDTLVNGKKAAVFVCKINL